MVSFGPSTINFIQSAFSGVLKRFETLSPFMIQTMVSDPMKRVYVVCKSFDLHVRIDKKICDISLFEYGDESHTIIKYSQEERNAVSLCDQKKRW